MPGKAAFLNLLSDDTYVKSYSKHQNVAGSLQSPAIFIVRTGKLEPTESSRFTYNLWFTLMISSVMEERRSQHLVIHFTFALSLSFKVYIHDRSTIADIKPGNGG